MQYWGDYHTHTTYSDGKGSVMQNAAAAIRAGLKEVAITDHGLGIPTMSYAKLLKSRKDCGEAQEKLGIKVLCGIEANIISLDGELDISKEQISELDILLAGFHKFAWPGSVRDFFKLYFHTYFNGILKPGRDTVRRNTRAFVSCVEKYPISILTHVGNFCVVDVGEVAKACADNGTFVELNGKHIEDYPRIIEPIIRSGALMIAGTDAHTPSKVGDMSRITEFILNNNVPLDRVVNLKESVTFRGLRR